MARILQVKAVGEARTVADEGSFSFYLEAKGKTYEQASARAAHLLNALQSAIREMGFLSSDLKTLSLTMEEDYEQVKSENGNYHSVFIGYMVKQYLELSFSLNAYSVPEMIRVLSMSKSYASFSLEYKLHTPNHLLEHALEDAMQKAYSYAQTLAEASQVQLGDILTIEFDENEEEFYPQSVRISELAVHTLTSIALYPKEMVRKAGVNVIFEIL